MKNGLLYIVSTILAATYFLGCSDSPTETEEETRPVFVGKWVYIYSCEPNYIDVAPDGTVYLMMDSPPEHVEYRDPHGKLLGSWYTAVPISGLAVAPNGKIYTTFRYEAETTKYGVIVWNARGEYLYEWGTEGTGDGEFSQPSGVAINKNGTVYVADTGNFRIQYFTATGSFLGKWGSRGSGNGQFESTWACAVAPNGNVYVSDGYNNRVQYFTSSGSFLGKWGSEGKGDGQFDYPKGIAVAPDGNVYVVDCCNHRIQYFAPTGSFLGKWGSHGKGDGEFTTPRGIAVATSGLIYVTDEQRVQIFR